MSNQAHDKQVVINRIVKKVVHKHHGGSWKIAYADFVTAMMTFFLLMWLLSLLNKYQLQGIANYFKKPLKEAFNSQYDHLSKNALIEKKTGPMTYNQSGYVSKTTNPGVDNPSQSKPNNFTAKGPDETALKSVNSKQDLEKMKADLEAKLQSDPVMSQFKNQLDFIVTSDGLKIVMKDLQNKPMFSEGGLDFQKYAYTILKWLTAQINLYNNKVMIIGHTDAVPYANNYEYTNWELSADRANATRRVLLRAGLSDDKVIRVVGGADTDLLDKKDSMDPSNRRIEIIVLTNKAMQQVQNQ